jgi:hypothetical protein
MRARCSWLSPGRVSAAVVALGLGLRAYHYLRGRAVWHDEAALLVNVLSKTFAELLGPLRFHEAAPPLFLWVTRAASLLLGDGELAVRLVPFLASCASLLLLVPVARRLLEPRAVPWALLLFACSEQLSWHACEAKPYAVDVLVAAVLLAVHCRTRGWSPDRRLLLYALPAPALIFLSYPACFLYGGVLVAHLPAVWGRGALRPWLAYALLGFAVGASFLALALGPVRAQHGPTIHACWRDSLPDWGRPWAVPGWAVVSTFEVFRYCCKPLGQPLAVLAVVGGALLWRSGRRAEVVLLVLPVALALVAACLHSYPYGGSRVLVYAAPAVVLLIAAGAGPTLAWLRPRTRLGGAAVGALLLLPAGAAVQRVLFVWPEPDVPGAAAFVEAHRREGDPVTGNDWTHLYYFRHLGGAFHSPEEDPPEPADRLWVVVTDAGRDSEAERMRLARGLAPPGWGVERSREFAFTTAVLFARPAGGVARACPGGRTLERIRGSCSGEGERRGLSPPGQARRLATATPKALEPRGASGWLTPPAPARRCSPAGPAAPRRCRGPRRRSGPARPSARRPRAGRSR